MTTPKDQVKDVSRCIPEVVLDEIYVALSDAYERIDCGKMSLKRCINYLETVHGYEPPTGYVKEA